MLRDSRQKINLLLEIFFSFTISKVQSLFLRSRCNVMVSVDWRTLNTLERDIDRSFSRSVPSPRVNLEHSFTTWTSAVKKMKTKVVMHQVDLVCFFLFYFIWFRLFYFILFFYLLFCFNSLHFTSFHFIYQVAVFMSTCSRGSYHTPMHQTK